ncbi:hypothetical protein EW026_g7872 [Hermanssonia centrifuga]|uniref:T6SS Phospholipase effector Tle1-like catalytic domain-containing protein n=1 Tax=Hermanssonia centrifuga TaxID=98765 RepID=A0A4S4K6B3_9APHY|nr:hypothetical protein EW026_g7872 [Hermanssonia centrifuga]
MLRKDDNSRQLVYYQAGLGTYTDPLIKTPVASKVSMVLDQMLAWNLDSHVKDGYTFLMENYTHGDKICIFGFSRGAYTARALAGMLQKVGLLPVCNHQQVPFAYEMYKREDIKGLELCHDFKETYARTVTVEFLGVWDTVASVGLVPRYLPFVHENTGVRYLRHALALDERRVKFIPQFCANTEPKLESKAEHAGSETQLTSNGQQTMKRDAQNHGRPKPVHQESTTRSFENSINRQNGIKPDVQEVWFAGVHCDVGGGAVDNDIVHKLARIPLRWMIRACFDCNTGIMFEACKLQKAGLPVYVGDTGKPVLAPTYQWQPSPPVTPSLIRPKRTQSMLPLVIAALCSPFVLIGTLWRAVFGTKTEETQLPPRDAHQCNLEAISDYYEYNQDMEDIQMPLNDQLEKKALWIFLDWFPQRVKKFKAIQKKTDDWKSYKWVLNRGKGRKIPRSETKPDANGDPQWLVHRTVKMRLDVSLEEPYVPQARPNIPITLKGSNGEHLEDPRRMTHEEWNVEDPQHWKWVV